MKNKLIKLILAVFTVIMPAQGDIYACLPAVNMLRPVAVAERPAGPVQNRTILDKKFKFSSDFKNRHNEMIRIMDEVARSLARLNVRWVAVKTTDHLSHTHNIPQIEMVDLRLPHDGYRSWSTGYMLSINELIYNTIDAVAIRWFEAGQPPKYRGIVRINIRKIGDDLLIEIDDNGVGFKRVELTKLFTPAKIQSKKRMAKYADLRLIGFAGHGTSKMYGRGLIAGLGGKIEIDTFRPDSGEPASGAHNLTYLSDSRTVISEGGRKTQGSTIRFTFPRIFDRKITDMLPGGTLLQDSQAAGEAERAILRPLAVLESGRGSVELSEDEVINSMPDQTARQILRQIGRDPYLRNVYGAALYLLRNGTKGVEKVIKKSLGRTGRYQEEFLGELVEARAIEMNVKYSRVLELSVERYGPEMDFVLEVDKMKYADRTEAVYPLEDGIYIGESKTQDRSDDLEAVIEITLEDKVKKYARNAQRMSRQGIVVDGVVFAIGGEITEANSIEKFHMEEMEKGKVEERFGLTLYLALIPDEIIKKGRDNLTPYEKDFAEGLIAELINTGRISPENKVEFEKILKQVVLLRGVAGVRFIMMDSLKKAGAGMLSIKKQRPEHWLKVFEALAALNLGTAAPPLSAQSGWAIESSI